MGHGYVVNHFFPPEMSKTIKMIDCIPAELLEMALEKPTTTCIYLIYPVSPGFPGDLYHRLIIVSRPGLRPNGGRGTAQRQEAEG